MWTCPNCKQTISELLSVKYDPEEIKKYKEGVTEAINKRIMIKEMVKEHNKSAIFNSKLKRWIIAEWKLHNDGFVCQIEEETKHFLRNSCWKVIEKAITPNKPKRHIECPMCQHRIDII